MKKDPVPDKSRQAIFKIIAISIPILLVILIEIALRLFGYGNDFKLFVDSPNNDGYLEMGDYASYKFFTNEANATVGLIEPFKEKKSADTYRIFVLGESTTIGFPYRHNGSFHRWLKYRLMFTFPETNFEIINLSLTAVNSYTILDFSKEIVNYEPDAVLIYVGHNEYYGALGIGSTSRMGSNPAIVKIVVKLRNIRLYQLLNNAVIKIRGGLSKKEVYEDQGLMVAMPAEKNIIYNSKKYEKGIRQFSINMEETCQFLSQNEIPVFLSTVVSNEKDLPPFISDNTSPEISAEYYFKKAKEAYEDEEVEKAKELFVKAKELDLLRFRAPEAINKEIASLAEANDRIYLVDAKKHFEMNSPNGIVGSETILEHVHPNLFGYAILSDAFYERMKQTELISNNYQNEMSFEELLQEMPVTIIDSLYGEYVLKFMLNSWPFTNDPIPDKNLVSTENEINKLVNDLFFREINWLQATGALLELHLASGNKRGALKAYEALALEYPHLIQYVKAAAMSSFELGDIKKSVYYTKKVFDMKPNIEDARKLSGMYLNMDRPGKAKEYLEYILANEQSSSNIPVIIEILDEIINLKTNTPQGVDVIHVYNKLALNYLRVGSVSSSRRYLAMVLRSDPKNEVALKTLQIVQQFEAERPELKN